MMDTPQLRVIGIVHGDILSCDDAPKNYDESERQGKIEIFPQYRQGLEGIVAGQTIVVLFWLHQADRETLLVYPRGDRSRGLRGVFATRSPARPNPVAISELRVLAVSDGQLAVFGLDILAGTPVIDIKKKIGR
jgi:tRNA (adenine37-N6)-methyltransferase